MEIRKAVILSMDICKCRYFINGDLQVLLFYRWRFASAVILSMEICKGHCFFNEDLHFVLKKETHGPQKC